MGNLLNSEEIQSCLLNPKSKDGWLPLFENQEFGKLPEGKHLGVFPFNETNIGPISLDLTVGDEVYSLRRAQKIRLSPESPTINIDPGETVLILTCEYLALSPSLAAITLSRARFMNEGISLSSAKVDPTWHGRLQIPITNNARTTFSLSRGHRFCTILFFQLKEPLNKPHFLSKENTPHLGQTTSQYEPRHATAWLPTDPEMVRDTDMKALVSSFGPPFDIINGMFVWSKRQVIEHMEQKWSPAMLRDVKQSIWAEEYEQIKQHREMEISLLREQIDLVKTNRKTEFTQSITWLIVILGWIATVIVLIITIFLKK